MLKKAFIAILIVVFFVSTGIALYNFTLQKGQTSQGCIRSGCNGEGCTTETSRRTLSPCLYRPEFACTNVDNCVMDKKGDCHWEKSLPYKICRLKLNLPLIGKQI